jgi:hypothetical protein
MHDSRHIVEQPFMGAVPNVVDVIVVCAAQVGPAFGNDRPRANCVYSVDNSGGDPFWVFQYDTAEPNIYRWRPRGEEGF